MKQAQLSIFIVTGALILLVSMLVYYSETKQPHVEELSFGTEINHFIQSCFDQASENALYDVSLQGGFFETTELSIPYFYVDVPIYWYKDIPLLPTERIIEQEISRYVEANFAACVDSFSSFKEQGYTVYGYAVSVQTDISDTAVFYEMNLPLTFEKGNQKVQITRVQTKVPIDYKKVLSHVSEIILAQEKAKDLIPMGFMLQLAKKEGFTFEVVEVDSQHVVTGLLYDIPFGEDLIFLFGSYYEE